MSHPAPARLVEPRGSTLRYQRHRPEQMLLFRIVAQHYPRFVEHMAGQSRPLPDYVQREFEDYLRCGRLEHGFLRVRCESCHVEHLVAFSCKRRGFCPGCAVRRSRTGWTAPSQLLRAGPVGTLLLHPYCWLAGKVDSYAICNQPKAILAAPL